MNGQDFCGAVLKEGKRAVTAITGKGGIERIQMDNCEVHNSARTTQRLEEFQITPWRHPPYSPDVSPCNSWFFGWSKDSMKSQQFQGTEDVQAFLIDLSRDLDPSRLI
jgi:hypothetical protein